MVYCLHCGACCKLFSPFSAPFPCPYFIQQGTFYLCGIYDRRHKICRDFYFDDHIVCPYGLNELHLSYPEDNDDILERVEQGERLIADRQRKRRENT